MGPNDEQEYHSDGEWPAIGPEDVSSAEHSRPSSPQPNLCAQCSGFAPGGWDLCQACSAKRSIEVLGDH